MAAAGVDASNVGGVDGVLLLPTTRTPCAAGCGSR